MTVGKPIVTFFVAFIMAVIGFWDDHYISALEWTNAGLVFISLFGVYLVPNLTGGAAKYAKLGVAAFGAAGTLLVTLLADGVTTAEWIQVIVAFLGALGVVPPKAPQYLLSSGTLKRAIT